MGEMMENKKCKVHIGDTIGDYEVISKDVNRGKYEYYYICKCKNCGFEKSIAYTSLTSAKGTKCSKCNDKFARIDYVKGYKDNLQGKRFGKLLVESFAGTNCSHSRWNCICDCGKKR